MLQRASTSSSWETSVRGRKMWDRIDDTFCWLFSCFYASSCCLTSTTSRSSDGISSLFCSGLSTSFVVSSSKTRPRYATPSPWWAEKGQQLKILALIRKYRNDKPLLCHFGRKSKLLLFYHLLFRGLALRVDHWRRWTLCGFRTSWQNTDRMLAGNQDCHQLQQYKRAVRFLSKRGT